MVAPVTENVALIGPVGPDVSVLVMARPAGRPVCVSDRVPLVRPDSAVTEIGLLGPSLYCMENDGADAPVVTSLGTIAKSRLLTSKK